MEIDPVDFLARELFEADLVRRGVPAADAVAFAWSGQVPLRFVMAAADELMAAKRP
jgi:hypothetical protein